MYTVIQKSGWQGDNWRVAKTFSNKDDAQQFVNQNTQPNARDDFYRTRIMSHRRPLAKMANWDSETVKFSDGTVAGWDIRL